MSKIKRFYENVADIVTDAMYEECMGMDDVIYSDRSEVWEETFQQLMIIRMMFIPICMILFRTAILQKCH